jgi:hypothetical protein
VAEVPTAPDDFRLRFEARFRDAVKETFTAIGTTLGLTTEFNYVASGCKPPMDCCEYGLAFLRDGQLWLAGATQWRYPTHQIAFDFEELLHARCPLKVLIFQRNWEEVHPVIAHELAAFPSHEPGEEYILIQATDYKRNLIAHTFRVPEAPGTIREADVVFQPVPGSPFPWLHIANTSSSSRDRNRQRALDAIKLGPSEDWYANIGAFACPVCQKVFIVSGRLNPNGRKCPTCGESTGIVTGEKDTGGAAMISW